MVQSAATLGCQHSCPAYTGDDAHQGGPVLQGSPDCFGGGKSFCRSGDPLHCNHSSPDVAADGSATVFINGLPASRRGDPTVHGGLITEGEPTIFIG